MDRHECLKIWRGADSVCFDVDSTVIQEEGIDVLAEYCGASEQVHALTKRAMDGDMKFQDALRQRLDIIHPSRTQIEECLRVRPLQFTPHVKELVRLLVEHGRSVFLVSGGFRQMIEPSVVQVLGLPTSHLVANCILFDEDGNYSGFDRNEPTSRSGGKQIALQRLQEQFNLRCTVMIGDGITDLEARPPAAMFIGFGGNKERDAVRVNSDWYIKDFSDLIAALDE